jgi:hypothetical protein
MIGARNRTNSDSNRRNSSMSTRNITLALVSGFALTAALSARAATILNNGDFELGTYSSTVGGFTSNQVPTGWTANAAFVAFTIFDRVVSIPESGNFALQISNLDSQPLAALTQSLADVSGDTYTVTFYTFDNRPDQDANAYLKVSAGSQSVTVPDTVGDSYKSFAFAFTGSGSDELTIAAQNTPGFFFVDNISVTGQSVLSSVPEPASFVLFCSGLFGLGFARLRYARSPAVSSNWPS